MLFHSRDSHRPLKTGDAAAETPWHALETTPVTLAVVTGPLIAVTYQLMRSPDAAAGSFSVAQAVRGLLCVLMFASLLLPAGLGLLTQGLVRPVLFLAAYAILTSFASPCPYEHIVFAVRVGFTVLVFTSAFRLAKDGLLTERWLTICAWIIVLSMAMCIGVGLATGMTVDAYRSRYATAGFTSHPAVASRLILSTLPVFISLIVGSASASGAILLLFTLLFFTMRRSDLIAGVAAMCVSPLINLICPGRSALWRRTIVLVGILILLATMGLHTPAGTDLAERFRTLNPSEGSGSGRYVFWQISLDHILNRPLRAQIFGEGLGSIRDLLRQRFGLSIGSHNDWLDLVNAFGVVGLIGITWWYLGLARLVWGLRGQPESLFQGACASVVILGLMSVGTGGSFDPSWALSYAAVGFWAGHAAKEREQYDT